MTTSTSLLDRDRGRESLRARLRAVRVPSAVGHGEDPAADVLHEEILVVEEPVGAVGEDAAPAVGVLDEGEVEALAGIVGRAHEVAAAVVVAALRRGGVRFRCGSHNVTCTGGRAALGLRRRT